MTDTRRLIQRLNEQAQKEGELPRLLKFYRELLEAQEQVEERMSSRPPVEKSREDILRQLEEGVPLLTGEDVTPYLDELRRAFKQVSTIYAAYADLFDIDMAQPEPEFPETPVRVCGGPGEATEPAGSLARSVLHSTLRPFITSRARALSFPQESWRRSYCPVCGGLPDLAYLDQEKGARWLLCSRCDTGWLYQRLQCPACGTQEQGVLSFLTDDSGRYRVYLCDSCRHYIKAIDLRQAGTGTPVALERFYTLGLDRQAIERGYKAP
ncbi:MAG: formate dehydrogenase accessory protein FdhE [Chloroflexi bacterium]|nr:formate dehydrogenase accessory protein FdhE [Chloroflexota bacterium]